MHHRQRLSLVFARRRDLRDLDPHRDEPGGFFRVQRGPGRVRGHERMWAEIEIVEFGVIQEADHAHPGPGDVVRILRFQGDARIQGDSHRARDIAVRRRAPEWLCPVRDGVFAEQIMGACETRHIVVQHDHDSFDFLPVDFLAAVREEGAPEGGVVGGGVCWRRS